MKSIRDVLVIIAIIGLFLAVACVEEPPKEIEPLQVRSDIEEEIAKLEKPKLLQEYPRITSKDLEELSETQSRVLDKGQEEAELHEEETSDIATLDSSSEEVTEEPEGYIEEEYTEEEYIEDATEEYVEETSEDMAVAIEEEEETAIEYQPSMTYLGAYDITAYEWTGYPCANGNYPAEGYTVACNSLPLGTVLYIDGIGYRTVEDRGADWHSDYWIDLYLGDVGACYEWGVRTRDVWIVN